VVRAPGPLGQAERDLAHQAELAYKHTVRDWTATRPTKAGRGRDTKACISKILEGKAARQTP
jgi:hypothetical protein